MTDPAIYWQETERRNRILQQDADRSSCVNDGMELVYSSDLDEVFAEFLRVHAVVGDPRTLELVRRVFPERVEQFPAAVPD